MTKEEFNSIWKDTSREGILNQFYYDYMYMKKLKEDINKAIEYIENTRVDNNYMVQEKYEYLLEILRGGEDNR